MSEYKQLAEAIVDYELKKLAGGIDVPASPPPKGVAPAVPAVGPQAARAKRQNNTTKKRKDNDAK